MTGQTHQGTWAMSPDQTSPHCDDVGANQEALLGAKHWGVAGR